jgi:putative transposase
MKKTKHSEEKLLGAVKQLEAGRSVKELARELGVTDQTLYNWKSKYGGLEVSDGKPAGAGRGESPAERDGGRSESRQGSAADGN